MAQHIPIINFINENWFFQLIKDCKKIVKKYQKIGWSYESYHFLAPNIKLLPIYYASDYDKPILMRKVNQIFSYKNNYDLPLTNEKNSILLKDCGIEIHSHNKEIKDIFIVA